MTSKEDGRSVKTNVGGTAVGDSDGEDATRTLSFKDDVVVVSIKLELGCKSGVLRKDAVLKVDSNDSEVKYSVESTEVNDGTVGEVSNDVAMGVSVKVASVAVNVKVVSVADNSELSTGRLNVTSDVDDKLSTDRVGETSTDELKAGSVKTNVLCVCRTSEVGDTTRTDEINEPSIDDISEFTLSRDEDRNSDRVSTPELDICTVASDEAGTIDIDPPLAIGSVGMIDILSEDRNASVDMSAELTSVMVGKAVILEDTSTASEDTKLDKPKTTEESKRSVSVVLGDTNSEKLGVATSVGVTNRPDVGVASEAKTVDCIVLSVGDTDSIRDAE